MDKISEQNNELIKEIYDGDKFVVYDLAGKIIEMSDNLLSFISKTNNQVYPYYVKSPNLYSRLDAIRKKVIEEKHEFSYVCIAEYESKQIINIVQHKPRFDNGELVGTIEILSDLTALTKKAQEILSVKLTKREIEIILLISMGITHNALANVFKLCRLTISNIINTIYNKLHISSLQNSFSKKTANYLFEISKLNLNECIFQY